MRESTAYFLLSEADAFVLCAILASLLEYSIRGMFSSLLLSALLSLFLLTTALAILYYFYTIVRYETLSLKGFGKLSRPAYSLITAAILVTSTVVCVFALPELATDHLYASLGLGSLLLLFAIVIEIGLIRRAIEGSVERNHVWRSTNQWGATGWAVALGMVLLASILFEGSIAIVMGALLGWAPIFVNGYYSTSSVIVYENRFSRLFLPALLSLDVSLTVAIFYLVGIGSTRIDTMILGIIALVIFAIELALVIGFSRLGLLKASGKKHGGYMQPSH